ncbi:MAG: hypothetical protein ACOZAK_02520 [Patescibacteria group bacterium]
MAKKRTKAQKKLSKTRTKVNLLVDKAIADKKDSFANQEKNYIINDLKKTFIYTLLVIAVLLGIFVYTKTS